MKKIILIIIFLLFPSTSSSGQIRVVLLNPGGNHWFWKMTIDFMKAAAEDLNMELEVVTSNRNRFVAYEQIKKIVKRRIPTDYIVTGNEKSSAGKIIATADKAGVKIFLFNNGFVLPEDIKKYGKPREKFRYWIGEMIPNNFLAGYQIGKTLIDEALSAGITSKDGIVHIAAIAGTYATHSSVERVKGLEKVIDEYGNKVKLLQVVPGDWGEERAEQICKGLFERYKEINVIWGANDTTAIGAMKHVIYAGKIPGKDILLGGCGWYAPAIEMVRQGKLAITVGGHFMDGGWVMVLLHDYHHGKDFMSDTLEKEMYSIDKSNVEKYMHVFGKQEWNNIDFKKFITKILKSMTSVWKSFFSRTLSIKHCQ